MNCIFDLLINDSLFQVTKDSKFLVMFDCGDQLCNMMIPAWFINNVENKLQKDWEFNFVEND